MMTIKIGDTVEAIDDAITGKVIKIDDRIVTVITTDNFEFTFDASELIVTSTDNVITKSSLSPQELSEIKREKETPNLKKIGVVKPKNRHRPTFVVDLHIHQLTDSTKGMTNFDMLNLQLDTARKQLEFAIKKRMPKMVFIHGVGEGVLRQELYTLLRRYNNVKFYDADYKTYGLGATEVRIFQNVEP